MNESFGGVIEQGYYGVTTLHPLGLAVVLVAGTALLFLPRRYAVWPLLVVAVFVSSAQRVVIASIDLDMLRIMTLFGFVRIITRGEIMRLRFKTPDIALLAWLAIGLVIYVVRRGEMSAFVNRSGWVFNGVGMYFLLRCLVQNWSDVDRIVQGFIILSVPIMAAFLVEKATGRNIFAIFGGVPERTIIRNGRLRCQGAYSHPIMAGTFWAAMLPLMWAWFFRSVAARWQAILGICCSLVIIVTCASSGPVMSLFFGLVAISLFPLRYWMKHVRWVAFGSLAMLHLLMEAPVWHLAARIDIVGGSTGYYRYKLIDETIRNFGQWWLIGTDATASWETGLSDITNQYVLEGINGGVATLLTFLLMIWLCFASVGRLWRMCSTDEYRTRMSWAFGVSLFVHAVSFLSVSYFGQITVVLFLTLALIVSVSPSKQEFIVHLRARRESRLAAADQSNSTQSSQPTG